MSDTAVTETEADSTPEVDESETFDADKARARIAKVYGEAKGLRARVKELEQYEAKAKADEDAKKSEIEKAADRAAKAEQRAAQVEAELIRERVARRHGITDDEIDLLGSGSEAEIEGRATRIAALKAASASAPVPPTDRSVEKLRPGATPKDTPPADDPNAFPAHWLPKRRAAQT